MGDKTVDYLKILVGISTSAIDRHLIKFIKKAGIDIDTNNYQGVQKIINGAADKMGIDRSILDHSIWKYMSAKKKSGICKND